MSGFHPCPKPGRKARNKNSRHQSNPVPTASDLCIICGKGYASTHECFGGSRRNLSRLYGLIVRLCWEHHQGDEGAHGKDGLHLRMWLERKGQMMFEEKHGTREDFIRIFGRSYL